MQDALRNVRYGDLALVLDTQEVYIRVYAGWQQVMLGDTYPPKKGKNTVDEVTEKSESSTGSSEDGKNTAVKPVVAECKKIPHLKLIALKHAHQPTKVHAMKTLRRLKGVRKYDRLCRKKRLTFTLRHNSERNSRHLSPVINHQI